MQNVDSHKVLCDVALAESVREGEAVGLFTHEISSHL